MGCQRAKDIETGQLELRLALDSLRIQLGHLVRSSGG
jgi:hypothetical protein